MNSISNVLLNSNSYSNRKPSLPSIAIEEDKIIESYSDIIDPQYRLWFIKRLKQLGKQEFIERAEKAKKYGNNPQKLFVSLLK
jgi:hypothetical protein